MKTFYPLLFFLLLKVSVDAATFIVTDTTASSPFSFAQAIADANALPGKDTIEFDIPGTLIRKIISDSLPDITDTVFVDGYSQPGNTSFPGILTLLGTRGLTIRTAGCKITVLNIQYSGFANIGISLIADSGKSISNTILSRCEMIDFPIGIKIFPSSPNSLNSANILIDSVWVDGGNGTIAFELTTTPTSDIAYVAISNCMFNSYSCPGGCYAGTACLVNRQNNSVLNPHYSFSRCRTIGELNFQGYLDSIYVGHCNMTGGCGYLIFENCSVNNALIEYNTISGGAAGCGTSAVTLGFSNFLNDTTRNIHVQNNEISGGDIDFDFSGNGQEVDSIFYENNRSAGNIYFQKLNVGNVDTQIVSNIFIRNNSSLGLGGITINLSFSGLADISDVYIKQNYFSGILTSNSSAYCSKFYIDSNFICSNSPTNGLTVEFDSNADSIFITNDSIYNNGVGINFNSGGSITHLYVLNNYITTSGSHSWGWPTRNGINFTNTFQLQAEIKHNRIISCADAGIAFYSSFVDSIYSLEIDSNIIANSGYFYGIGVPTLSYNPPTNNLGRLTFLGNSIYGNAQQGIYRYSMRDTTSNYCALCIPLPTLIGADYNTGITTVDGTLQGDTLSPYIIEFFRNTIADTSGYGEGEYFINRDTVFTDATGHATFSVPLVGNFLGQYITATSTSLVRWQTSEFSNDVIVNSISEINEQRKNGFVIFPNPAHNSFTLKNISFENPTGRTTENFQVQIVNLLGEIVYSEKLFGKNEYSIHTNLSSGIYFVKMNTEKGSVVKKLLVTKD